MALIKPVNKYPDELIEKVARLYCEAMKLDPEEMISGDVLMGKTDAERFEYLQDNRNIVHAVMIRAPRWVTYRQFAIDLLTQRELANKLDLLLKEYELHRKEQEYGH